MKIQYCLPIIKSNQKDVMRMIAENQDYNFYEVWLDYIEDFDELFLEKLIATLGEKLILLFRRQKLEPIKMDLAKRKTIMDTLHNSFSLLDLDLSAQKEELQYMSDNKLNMQIIVSYHNYQETPTYETLNEIVHQMQAYKPTIYKIATTCQTEEDSLRLLALPLQLKKENKQCIILGMGEKGSITRIFGTLWGNEMIFAPKEKTEQSAQGQFTKQELEKIFSIIC